MSGADSNPNGDQRAVRAVDGRFAPKEAYDEWPDTDPELSTRLYWVAHYAVLNYSAAQIAGVLTHHIPNPVDATTVSHDLRRIMAIQRRSAMRDAEGVFAEIDDRFIRVFGEQMKLYFEAEQWRKEIDPRTKEERVIAPATPLERASILSMAQRTLTARSIHRFGSRGGMTINLNNNTQNNRTVVLGSKAKDGVDIRELATQLRAEMSQPSLAAAPDDDTLVIDAMEVREVDDGLQRELDEVAASAGTTGLLVPETEEEREWTSMTRSNS